MKKHRMKRYQALARLLERVNTGEVWDKEAANLKIKYILSEARIPLRVIFRDFPNDCLSLRVGLNGHEYIANVYPSLLEEIKVTVVARNGLENPSDFAYLEKELTGYLKSEERLLSR